MVVVYDVDISILISLILFIEIIKQTAESNVKLLVTSPCFNLKYLSFVYIIKYMYIYICSAGVYVIYILIP